jgi:molybdate/tungstate transport system substrate-binding protein
MVSYSPPSDREIRGGLISHESTIRETGDAASNVFAVHSTGDSLDEHGFLLCGRLPGYEGNVPQRVERATNQSGGNHPTGNQPVLDGSTTELSPAVSDTTVLVHYGNTLELDSETD